MLFVALSLLCSPRTTCRAFCASGSGLNRVGLGASSVGTSVTGGFVRFNVACVFVYGVAIALVLASTVAPVHAGLTPAPDVPEIDGGTIAAGLGLLSAGVLILRARRGSK